MDAPSEDDDDRYHVVASSSLTANGTRVLKNGDTFAVFNRFGDIQAIGLGEQGIYHRGTRHVSGMRLKLDKQRLLLLSSTVLQNNLLLAVDLTNPDIYDAEGTLLVSYGTIHIFRSKFLREGACFERLQISNYGRHAVEFVVRMDFSGDFVDVFEVRGTKRERRGEALPGQTDSNSVTLSYRGLDDVVRSTRFEFAPSPDALSDGHASFRVALEAQQTKEIFCWVSCSTEASHARLIAYEAAFAEDWEKNRRLDSEECSLFTSNEQFNDWLNRSHADLRMMVTETPFGPYPYAGVPWFSTPFGRDAIWTALEALWVRPDLAAGVLRFLAHNQAAESDADADADSGKILHEMRDGEMAALREIPFGKYYGSIDSTPLFLMLAGAYYEATEDRALIESIWPNLLSALDWLDRWGDVDGDGFLEYGRRSKTGLVQQGWKDSNDSVFHHDGTLAEGPIAICEVQGYTYAAKRAMARLARSLLKEELSLKLEQQARALRKRFDAAFWCEDLNTYALALDAKKLPCRVKTSNAGHCLYTGIVLPERAPKLARQLVSDEMFSGFGIRTLAQNEQRYNPMAYHNGSIWPHDNAIIAAGLARYGHKQEAATVLSGLFDASLFVELHRLPELFCGFKRRVSQGPTLYPVACSPQAWASAAVFLLLRAVLGLNIDAITRRITFEYPVLPPFLEQMVIRNLRVADARVDLQLHRHPDDVGINVMRKTGQVEIIVVK